MKILACSTTLALVLWAGASPGQQPAVAPAGTALPPADAPLPRFEELDADADRVITLREVPTGTALHRDFARWDANKDGVLNVPEYQRLEHQVAQLD